LLREGTPTESKLNHFFICMLFNKFRFFALSVARVIPLAVPVAGACDTCGCFIPTEDGRPLYSQGWFAGIGEQFTYFGTDLNNGQSAPNPTGQYLASSTTQIIGGYRLTDRFSVQLSIPLIYRQYLRPVGFNIQRGTVAGLGATYIAAGQLGLTWDAATDNAVLALSSVEEEAELSHGAGVEELAQSIGQGGPGREPEVRPIGCPQRAADERVASHRLWPEAEMEDRAGRVLIGASDTCRFTDILELPPAEITE
jgi:hypothetical protein